jgi:hypothetical protein
MGKERVYGFCHATAVGYGSGQEGGEIPMIISFEIGKTDPFTSPAPDAMEEVESLSRFFFQSERMVAFNADRPLSVFHGSYSSGSSVNCLAVLRNELAVNVLTPG